MADFSPKWKKPSDIMKIHRKKKRLSQKLPSNKEKTMNVFEDCTSTVINSSGTLKRNPFSLAIHTGSPSKRQRTDGEVVTSEEKFANPFFNILENIEKKNGMDTSPRETTTDPLPVRKFSMDDDDSRSHFDFVERFVNASQKAKTKEVHSEPKASSLSTNNTSSTDNTKHHQLPVDWSLKVKFRVVSQYSLGWCMQLRTAEEAKGVTQFVRGLSNHMVSMDTSEEKSAFQSCCMYWIYPNLPWLRLFPRIVPDSKISVSNAGLLQEDVQAALQNDWVESFTSAFHQLRAQQCPYFYVCTHQFTVLFRCAGIAGESNINAFLTPTTRGFREALNQEGITFSMPVLERKKKGTAGSVTGDTSGDAGDKEINNSSGLESPLISPAVNQDDDDDDDFIDNDEGASVWLESIGLDKKQFPSLEPNKVKLQRDGFKVIDNRPESLVYVEGGDVQGLFNFLLNCRSCVASSGPQAGVPPTILSPTGFKGATLKSHKIKHSTVKQTDNEGNIKQVNILEINGPCLPHHVHNLTSLLKHTQKQDFSMTFNTFEPSVPFNAVVPTGERTVSLDRTSFGMDTPNFDPFFKNLPVSDRLSCIRELYCNDRYTWNT